MKALLERSYGHRCACASQLTREPRRAVQTYVAAASSVATAPLDSPAPSAQASFEFVCPICLTHKISAAGHPARAADPSCPRCRRTFSQQPDYLDLTLTSGLEPVVYNQKAWGGTELFRSPLISYVYERGWRQGFLWAGFPGVDKEFDMAMQYLQPAYGKVLVDMSCGSGLFSRRFARSGCFSGVVAADFSESMLQQAKIFFQEDGTLPSSSSTSSSPAPGSCPLMLLRADVARLPFETGSVAAIHAGAAIHCWPNPQAALAEISRVLAPGGVFVGTTFMVAAAPLGAVVGDSLVRPLNQLDKRLAGPYKWWEEAELRDLSASVGLQDFKCERQWRFIMFAATKPQPLQ
ncbi:S-adenosyl-L-methionine-dependent methyltransferase [Haematococcus lacustris]